VMRTDSFDRCFSIDTPSRWTNTMVQLYISVQEAHDN
jgi:hypothetical protein